jgi:hypothetical protein
MTMPEFLQLMETERGFDRSAMSVHTDPAALTEALRLIRNEHNLPRHRHTYLLHEAITSSDFPTLFGVLLQHDLLAKYKASIPDWRSYCATGSQPNFNIATKHKVYGQDSVLPVVAEKGPYTAVPSGTGHYHAHLEKYGRVFDISWEAVINDSMGAFSDIANRFSVAAQRTEAFNVTSLFVGAAGPNAGLFGAPIADVDGQNVTNQGALALSIANLQTTLRLMAAQTDPNGLPIQIRGVHLVVPPALEFTARAIITSSTVFATAAAFPGVPQINITPQLGIQLHVNPFLPVIDATGNDNGTWYVFCEPSEGRAIQMDFLAGNESPEICMKSSDKIPVGGGGEMSPYGGDFATDDMFYRVRHVMGGWQLDPRYAYAQVSA